MGGGSWDPGAYKSAASTRKATGVDDFDYDKKVKSGAVSGIHDSLDPKKVAGPSSPLAGMNVRESRDSDEHPESLPVAVLFDVTGSMGGIPRTLQTKLVKLMDVIIEKTGVKHPQILVGGIGDSSPRDYRTSGMTDNYPFQVGQFESDNRFDEALRNIILEGGGGGQVMESYALAYRFAAYHTATDAWEKRGKKGYLFTMGDEAPWPTVTVKEIEKIFGVQADGDESVEDLVAKAKEKWEVYHLFSLDGSYPDRNDIKEKWRKLLGERFVLVEDSSLICEIIAGIIYSNELAASADAAVDAVGLKGRDASVVKNALVPVTARSVPSHVAKGTVARPKGSGAAPGVSRV